MNEYRTDAGTKRAKIVYFAPSWIRAIAMVGCAGFLLIAMRALLFTETEARFTCTRDESGRGTCEHTVTFLGRVERESFEARSLEGARLEEADKKGVYRALILVGGKHITFSHATSREELPAMARQIDDFAHDQTQRHLDVHLGGPFPTTVRFSALAVAIAVVLVFEAMRRFPRRRLVLDEESGAARLERRWLRRWVPEWSRPLSDLRGARMLRGARSSSVVVDTERDGVVYVVEASRAHDPAVDEINDFVCGK